MKKPKQYQPLLFDDGGARSFDAAASEQAKQDGMQAAAVPAAEVLEFARSIARELARRHNQGITADDVVYEMTKRGYDQHCLGNAAGSLFRGEEWRFTGERRKSARVHAHSNELKVWMLK